MPGNSKREYTVNMLRIARKDSEASISADRVHSEGWRSTSTGFKFSCVETVITVEFDFLHPHSVLSVCSILLDHKCQLLCIYYTKMQ